MPRQSSKQKLNKAPNEKKPIQKKPIRKRTSKKYKININHATGEELCQSESGYDIRSSGENENCYNYRKEKGPVSVTH